MYFYRIRPRDQPKAMVITGIDDVDNIFGFSNAKTISIKFGQASSRR